MKDEEASRSHFSESVDHPSSQKARVVRSAVLLPIVRAAMARGEGPAVVVNWVWSNGMKIVDRTEWTRADEDQARNLACRLAQTLNDEGRDHLIGGFGHSILRARANAQTEDLRDTIVA